MKAFLLAAGLGTRLRPITEHTPKCLLRIGDRPLLDIWLDALNAAGVSDVLLNLHHLAPVVRSHLASRRGAPCVHAVEEPELLGSAGTLLANRDFVAGEVSFLAVNADNLTDFDLRHLIDAHRRSDTVATLSLFRTPRPSECGIVEVDGDGLVVDFVEKPAQPRGDLANAGMYAFRTEVLDEIEPPTPKDIGYHLLPALVGRAQSVVLSTDTYFLDIGTPAALEQARTSWESRRLS